jgi:DNA-binding transcriptional regulator YdaS (Cro superfamily)
MNASATKLSIALQAAGISRTDLAQVLQCSPQFVSALCTGQKKLSTPMAQRIEYATLGKVAANDILTACETCGRPLDAPDPHDEAGWEAPR